MADREAVEGSGSDAELEPTEERLADQCIEAPEDDSPSSEVLCKDPGDDKGVLLSPFINEGFVRLSVRHLLLAPGEEEGGGGLLLIVSWYSRGSTGDATID